MITVNIVAQSGYAWEEEIDVETIEDASDIIQDIVDEHGDIERVELVTDDGPENIWTMDDKMTQKFTHNGKEYTLTADAVLSNRVFPGWYNDVLEGEVYQAEYQADAVDAAGNDCLIVWHFDETRGEEIEDEGNYPWDDDHIYKVIER